MLELGRVQKTIFVARFLLDRDLQREINEGLNVVESFNRGNSIIHFGNGGDLPPTGATSRNLVSCACGSCRPP
jgi:TnpA family transposase